MKRVHVFQHVPFETPGCIIDWAKGNDYTLTTTRFFKGEPLPEPSSVDWLVVMGGPMSVHDTGLYPWLREEKRFIDSAVLRGKKIIGICLGSQLIAEVLGGNVRNNGKKEIGWHMIFRTEACDNSLISETIPYGMKVFHWHGETFDIPHGAVHIASSECCGNQAFIFDNNVLGLQFHMEVTQPLLQDMVDNCRDELVLSEYVQDEKTILSGMEYIGENNRIMYSLLGILDTAGSSE